MASHISQAEQISKWRGMLWCGMIAITSMLVFARFAFDRLMANRRTFSNTLIRRTGIPAVAGTLFGFRRSLLPLDGEPTDGAIGLDA